MKRPRAALAIASAGCLCALAAAAATGCKVGGNRSEADELRARLDAAEKDLARVTAERNEAVAKLAEAERVRLAVGGDLPTDVALALPRCAGIEIDRFTGIEPIDDPARDGERAIDVYVRPFDGRQRFVQIVGRLTVRADLLPAAGDADAPTGPRTLARAQVGPAQLREAFRSSLMGTHYAIRLTIEGAPIPPGSAIAVSAEFLDALSGQAFRAERIVRADPAR